MLYRAENFINLSLDIYNAVYAPYNRNIKYFLATVGYNRKYILIS
jgi:hypothetical protein